MDIVKASIVATWHGRDRATGRQRARTLGRMNIDASAMNHADLSRALPTLRDTLSMFFSAEEVAPRARALATLASQSRHVAA